MFDLDLPGLSLEEAMICYAIRARSRAYRVDDWRFFKLEFPCENTAQELYDKFWNEIIPNKQDYSIIEQKPAYGILLSFITNPFEIVYASAPTPVPNNDFQHIHMKPFFAALREEDKRKERARFEDPQVLRIKETATKLMANSRAPNSSVIVTPERSQIIASTGTTVTSRPRSSNDRSLLLSIDRSLQSSLNDGSVGDRTENRSPSVPQPTEPNLATQPVSRLNPTGVTAPKRRRMNPNITFPIRYLVRHPPRSPRTLRNYGIVGCRTKDRSPSAPQPAERPFAPQPTDNCTNLFGQRGSNQCHVQ